MAEKKKTRARALTGDRGWVGMLRLALLPGILGLCLLPLTTLDWMSELARAGHTRIDAVIESCTTHQSEEAMGRSKGRGSVPVYHASAVAKFESGGKAYTCGLKTQAYDAGVTEAFVTAHAKGATMPVWYDAADPGKASGVPPDPKGAGLRAALAAALAIGGFGLFWFARTPPDPV